MLTVSPRAVEDALALTVCGTLDTSTYRQLRDEIIKAALDEPSAVIIDVCSLEVPASSAWSVFTSARWHVRTWPEIMIALVCDDAAVRKTIAHNGIQRYVPVFPTLETATDAVSHADLPRWRRRARADLPATEESLNASRGLVEEWLTTWSQTELIPVSKVVVTALVENVLQHTDSRPNVRLETDGVKVTVAVSDGSSLPANFREAGTSGKLPTGLWIVSSLCRAWGNAPTPTGKTIWAVVGPENRL
ncbi:STAS domain-containing protein [Mycobacterium sp. NPDC051804]|uniref:STAS domain-containing protein n=1 Tax=Mycobacterium sp. NPDC051804 TaxID=3364295 RepID=UPI0037B676B2